MRDRHFLTAILIACVTIVGCSEPTAQDHLAAAVKQMGIGNAKEASVHLKAALAANPSSAEGRFLLGSLFLSVGEATAAAVELEKARQLQHPADRVVPALARALLEAGDVKRVIDEFSTLTLSDPIAAADLGATVASAKLSTGDSAGARIIVDKVLASQPKHARALLAAAFLDASSGATEAGLRRVGEAIASDPRDGEAYVLKGRLLTINKVPEEALRAYEKAVEVQPTLVGAHAEIIQHHLRLKDYTAAEKQFEALRRVQPKHFQTRFFSAQFAALHQDYKGAQETLRGLLQSAPNNLPVLVLAGVTDLQLGALGQAEARFNKAITAAPQADEPRLLLSRVLLQGGQTARALDILKPLIDRPKPSADALPLAAEIHMQLGDARKADALFARALEIDPDNTQVRTTQAIAQLARGQTEVATAALASIAASDKGTVADLALISSHLQRKQWDRALEAIDKLQGKQPDKPLGHALRGRVLALKGDAGGARTSFDRAIGLDPNFMPAVSGLAALDLASGQPDLAAKRFEAVLKTNPNNVWALMALAETKANATGKRAVLDDVVNLLTQAQQANPGDPTPSLKLIDYYLSNKSFAKAATLAQDLESKMPGVPAVLEAAGRAQAMSGDNQRALSTFARLAAMQPTSAAPQLQSAQLQLLLGNFDAAVQGFKRALELAPGSIQAERGLVSTAMRSKQPAKVLEAARALRAQQGNGASGWVVEGDVNAWRKNWPGAITAYAEALKLVPNDDAVAQRMHLSLTLSGKLPEARRFAQDWVKAHPQNAEFSIFLGDAALAKGDLAEAEARFQDALASRPDHPSALNNMAWLMSKRGAKGAVDMAQKAVALMPGNAVFLDTLALALSSEGQTDKALATAKQVVALAPGEPTFGLSLARIQLKAGDKAGALAELDKLAKLGPSFKQQAEVRALRAEAGG